MLLILWVLGWLTWTSSHPRTQCRSAELSHEEFSCVCMFFSTTAGQESFCAGDIPP